MYNDYDFHGKLYIGKEAAVATTGTSFDLTPFKLGMFNNVTHEVVTAANAASHPVVYLAQGSSHGAASNPVGDKIGQFHGGYNESIKSPGQAGIHARRVSRFYKVSPQAQAKQKVVLFWDGSADGTGPVYQCNQTYYIRLEVKGESVLRGLNRYWYKHLAAFTGCCADNCAEPCEAEPVDAALVMRDYAKQINEDPIAKWFITATPIYKNGSNARVVVGDDYVSPTLVADKAAVAAGLEIEVTYSDTVFPDFANFSPGDYYLKGQSITIHASALDKDGDPCTDEIRLNSSTGEGVEELVAPRPAEGLADTVIRDYIFSQLHRLEDFQHEYRMKTILADTTGSSTDFSQGYVRYYIQYSVPQRQNPSNTYSEDQYLLSIAIVSTNTALQTSFEALMAAWLTAHNPAVTLETAV